MSTTLSCSSTASSSFTGWSCSWCQWPSPSSCPDVKLLLAASSLPLSCLESFLRQDGSNMAVIQKHAQGKGSDPALANCFMHLFMLQQYIQPKKVWKLRVTLGPQFCSYIFIPTFTKRESENILISGCQTRSKEPLMKVLMIVFVQQIFTGRKNTLWSAIVWEYSWQIVVSGISINAVLSEAY